MRASHQTTKRLKNDDAPTAGPAEPRAYSLPRGWQVIPFLQAVRKSNAHLGMVRRTDYLQSGRFPIIDQGQSTIAGYWDSDEGVYQAELPVIVFGDHTRVFKFIDFRFIAGAQGTHVLVPESSRFDPYFLYLALGSLSIPSRGYNRHFPLLREQLIVSPPLSEQRAIASVLRAVQRAKEACERVIAAMRHLKLTLMHCLFTYGPVTVEQAGQVPLKETEIGLMPAHWSVVPLGELGDIVTGTTPSTRRPEYFGEPHLFVTPGDIGHGKYIATTERRVSAAGLRVCRALPKGAVVVVCIGATIGKTGLTAVDSCATNQQCNSIVANEKVEPEFLFYALSRRSSVLPQLAGRAAVPIVSKRNFSAFRVTRPPFSEQLTIASHLSAVDAKLAAEETRLAALDNLFKSLLHHLMTGKVRVNHLVDQLAGQITDGEAS